MAFPTAVNSQITDAITQSNVKVIGEAPAFAMGSIYQSLAHSTGILFENAVAAQQQQNTISQAAATQGVMQIYSIDSTAAAGAKEKVAQTGVSDNLTSLLTVLNAFRSPAAKAEAVESAPPDATPAAPTTRSESAEPANDGQHLNAQIKDAVSFANDTVLGHAHALNVATQECAETLVQAIERVQYAEQEAQRRMLLDAALATTLAAMIREPQRAKEYEEVLQAIKRLG